MMAWQRNRINDFRCDRVFMELKRIASSGKGKRGPLFDKGVLSVIDQIEKTGQFVPSPITALEVVPRAIKGKVLTPDELEHFEQMARQLGMTFEQASDFAAGIRTAEASLSDYKSPVIASDLI